MNRLAVCTLLTLLLCGCASTTPGGVPIDTRHTAKGQDSRALFLVIHYTAGSFESALQLLTEGEVSAHYLISDEAPPVIYRLVDENRRAWHAGPSCWRELTMLNASSIGIEIAHPGFRNTAQGRDYLSYRKAQIDALIPLLKDIVARHGIAPERVLGHSDIAPQRKEDPGPMFPWRRLADEGIVSWPDAARVAMERAVFEAALPDVAWFQQALGRHGFCVLRTGVLDDETRRVLSAFQMHYRPSDYGGQPDAETAALLHVLTTPP